MFERMNDGVRWGPAVRAVAGLRCEALGLCCCERFIDAEFDGHGAARRGAARCLDLAAIMGSQPVAREFGGGLDHQSVAIEGQSCGGAEPHFETIPPYFVGQACPHGRHDILIVHWSIPDRTRTTARTAPPNRTVAAAI